MIIEYYRDILNSHSIDVKVHSFFGLMSFIHGKILIAIEKNGQLFLQTKGLSQDKINEFGLKSHNEFHCYLDELFLLAEDFSQQPTRYVEVIQLIIEQANLQRSAIIEQKLHALPNLNIHLASLLRKIAITNTEAFFEIGAVDAFYFLKKKLGKDLSIRILWRLAGAELGVRWEVLTDQHKQQLRMMLAEREVSQTLEINQKPIMVEPTYTQHLRSLSEHKLITTSMSVKKVNHKGNSDSKKRDLAQNDNAPTN